MSALQDLSTSWNWAHVQISGDDSLTDTLATASGNAISRLLCPRRLDPETSYSAFLVPAFQNGVQAGLGQDVSSLTTSDPAWTQSTQGPLTLPFYFRFDFNTSDEGDFESLVRRLTPRVLPASVGQRPMDVSQPDPGIPPAASPLPPGLTLNTATGAITGTPTAAGTYNFRGHVADSTNSSAGTTTTNCNIVVAPAGIQLNASSASAQVGVAYDSALAATGGSPPYTFSIAGGSLPPRSDSESFDGRDCRNTDSHGDFRLYRGSGRLDKHGRRHNHSRLHHRGCVAGNPIESSCDSSSGCCGV